MGRSPAVSWPTPARFLLYDSAVALHVLLHESVTSYTTRRVPTCGTTAERRAVSAVGGPGPGLRGAERIGRGVFVVQDGAGAGVRGGGAVVGDQRGAGGVGAASVLAVEDHRIDQATSGLDEQGQIPVAADP